MDAYFFVWGWFFSWHNPKSFSAKRDRQYLPITAPRMLHHAARAVCFR